MLSDVKSKKNDNVSHDDSCKNMYRKPPVYIRKDNSRRLLTFRPSNPYVHKLRPSMLFCQKVSLICLNVRLTVTLFEKLESPKTVVNPKKSIKEKLVRPHTHHHSIITKTIRLILLLIILTRRRVHT